MPRASININIDKVDTITTLRQRAGYQDIGYRMLLLALRWLYCYITPMEARYAEDMADRQVAAGRSRPLRRCYVTLRLRPPLRHIHTHTLRHIHYTLL